MKAKQGQSLEVRRLLRPEIQGQEGGGFAPRGASDTEVQCRTGSPSLPKGSLGERGAPLSPQDRGPWAPTFPRGPVTSPPLLQPVLASATNPTWRGNPLFYKKTAFPPEKETVQSRSPALQCYCLV